MLWVQFGFLFLLNFADLTVPMLLYHLLTFDPAWVKARNTSKPETVYYDGQCGLCHRVVRFVLAEDRNAQFRFSPIEGNHFRVVDCTSRTHTMSDAYVHILRRLGGIWGLAGMLLGFIPKRLRDIAYARIARNRYRLFEKPTTSCPVVPPGLRERFVVPSSTIGST
jgi:predicted DCC family thiol-disulfide oxidoreductase YuxK